uniref:Putative conserved secreted protein n=1 Tax=Rhipicephalus microplus TaxID=6941 RepID=A0A6G5A0T6_RHIMP
MIVVPTMAPINLFFACLLRVALLAQLKAWAPSENDCHRLVPLQITSVVTPCVYPCLLIFPNNENSGIVLRQEVDGTPCKITRNPSISLKESKCMNGVCQFLDLGLQLKRSKREIRLIRKRRGLFKKVKEKFQKRGRKGRRRKHKRKQTRLKRRLNKNINTTQYWPDNTT